MEYQTKELTIKIRPDNIIEIKAKKDLEEFTLEGAKENVAMMEEIVGNDPRCVIAWMPDKYMKKDIIKYYNDFEQEFVTTALITKSFSSKIIGNLFITLRTRFVSKGKRKTNPIQLFTSEEEAVKWLLSVMATYDN
ncbi:MULTISPECIES: hypothetical protein [unclassified Aureispira]|uniref:DUF7793 family protein n=1 Tax=unclassified Aureispira TaxID=2649989 RepID=UPI0006978653|nr:MULTISPECIES: hypothetical protein [unclassified Aureispira]WMX16142.1 hypothetical protein QP953_07165 [Aureispira sp. CCB-E]